ncbi:hypothetical protein [Halocalculus aciditolerans]|uniref:Type II secretion system protein n=1 Tax=Halocalculus aciditolerans TaxID=1383812 RepID=A0A830F825_9EURY|nr:hypothetical protein [Halocalculus aciditolerans]GGL72567.1 hypothetical protein GCM10009039_33180 [Halocalculus aciditolerans]
MTSRSFRRLAAAVPIDPGRDRELDAALARVGWETGSRTLRSLAILAAAATAVLTVACAPLAPLLAAVVCLLGASGTAAVLCGPRLLAAADRARADGDGPGFVCRATLGIALHGTLEAAVDTASDGPLGRELTRCVAAAHGDPVAGWRAFRERVADRSPAFAGSLALLDAATDAPPAERDRLLDAAVAAARRATRERFGDYAAALHGPVSGVYAFGVVLPLALVGVLPVLPSAGATIPLGALALCYDVALPLALAAASAWLVARRPLALPAPGVPTDHPDVPDSPAGPLALGLAAGVAGSLACRLVVPTAAPVTGVGLALGIGLLAFSRPREAIRDRYERVARGLPAATTAAATRLVAGDPPERALTAAGSVPGSTGDVFADAATRRRALSLTPTDAVSGPYGALPTDALPGVARTVRLLVTAADAGPRGGRVLRDYADARHGLHELAADLRAELGHTTGTLRTTGRFFAPGIAGATVALAGRVRGLGQPAGTPLAAASAGAPTETFAVGTLALVVGAYVLWLAALLPVLAAGLDGPLDRTALAGAAGRGLLAASVVFPATLCTTGRLV